MECAARIKKHYLNEKFYPYYYFYYHNNSGKGKNSTALQQHFNNDQALPEVSSK